MGFATFFFPNDASLFLNLGTYLKVAIGDGCEYDQDEVQVEVLSPANFSINAMRSKFSDIFTVNLRQFKQT